jgi:hypothetical protein
MRTRFAGYNITIFLLFFGIALLDAIRSGDIGVTLFWVFVALVFVYGDVQSVRQRRHV